MQRQFNLQPSIYFTIALVASHGAALAVLAPLSLSLWARTLLALLVLISLLYHVWQDAWLLALSSNKTLLLDGDMVLLVARNGDQVTARVLADSLVTPFITVLNVLPQGAYLARSIIILPDSLDAESFRQLRVWLKWES
ncbi:protein YgfX [Candidatus Nitrotoga sp. 1052]|uniref:protein YgfX n=1 Tax=Candidatus Nitrotoga sp. 1052 TaxID=2886964 RepID=UPI001EF422F3|nr:protein YgfX [Candidatus Nitrotoga sp. 1052]CAH1091075.1 Toxin CptA [Candidatus Nitrotoga sp. 1052]